MAPGLTCALPVSERLPQIGEGCPQFAFRFLVALRDSESQSVFQHRLGIRASAELDERLSQQNARHHPIRLGGYTKLEVGHRLGEAAFCDVGLCQTESE